jgi:pimeloyl-ACP methyl ester carboxylesterase
MARPLSPDEIFPARSTDITQRFLSLPSGVRVRIAESGPRDGPTVLALPGWGGALYMYRHAFGELTRRGIRVIASDLRGFGLSDRPRARGAYALDAYMADVLAIMDALQLDAPILMGQSMGGGLALRFALAHPERVTRVVLINPTGLIALRFLPFLRVLPRMLAATAGRWFVPRAMVAFILRRLAYGDATKVSEHDVDEYWAPTQLPGYVYAARAALGEFDWNPVTDAEAASMAVPTMVILGRSDRLVRNDERAVRRLPGVRVLSLEGGHCVHEESPGEAYRGVAEFIRGVRGT